MIDKLAKGFVDFLTRKPSSRHLEANVNEYEKQMLMAQFLKIKVEKKLNKNTYIVSRGGERGIMNLEANLIVLGINPETVICGSSFIEFEKEWKVESCVVMHPGSTSPKWRAKSYATRDIFIYTHEPSIVIEKIYKQSLMIPPAEEYLIYTPTNKKPKQFYEEMDYNRQTRVMFGSGFIGIEDRWYAYSFTVISLFTSGGIKVADRKNSELLFVPILLYTKTPRNILFFNIREEPAKIT